MLSPAFYQDLCLCQYVEDVSVEPFIAALAIKTFIIAVLPRTTRLGKL